MPHDFQAQLSAAADNLGITVPNRVQSLYDDHKRFLSGKVIPTPLEEVCLLDANFPYWIKLEYRNIPTKRDAWLQAKAKTVIPLLDAGTFDIADYRYDEMRAKALLDVPNLLRNPDCIHANLRHANRGQGGIHGRYVYVSYVKSGARKVAFSSQDVHIGKSILVTSFVTQPGWVTECADSPALYVRKGFVCQCCR